MLYGNLGSAQLALGRNVAAVDSLRSALELDPESSELHYNLGLALHRSAQRSSAKRSYERTIELDPMHAAAHNNLANLLREMGDEIL